MPLPLLRKCSPVSRVAHPTSDTPRCFSRHHRPRNRHPYRYCCDAVGVGMAVVMGNVLLAVLTRVGLLPKRNGPSLSGLRPLFQEERSGSSHPADHSSTNVSLLAVTGRTHWAVNSLFHPFCLDQYTDKKQHIPN